MKKILVFLVLFGLTISVFAGVKASMYTEKVIVDNFTNSAQRTTALHGQKSVQKGSWIAKTDNDVTTINGQKTPFVTYAAGVSPNFFLPDKEGSLGVFVEFKNIDRHYIQVLPTDQNGNPTVIRLPGKVHKIGVWVWGDDYAATNMKVIIQDYKKRQYILDAGSLAFKGWKNIELTIPRSIIYADPYNNFVKGYSLVGFLLTTSSMEQNEPYYYYFSHLYVDSSFPGVTDTYDGYKLKYDKNLIDSIWARFFQNNVNNNNNVGNTGSTNNPNNG